MDSKKTLSVDYLLGLSEGDLQDLLISITFEQGLALLEQLVQKVESGQLPLEVAVTSYEKGVAVANRLRALLHQAEERVRMVTVSEGGVALASISNTTS